MWGSRNYQFFITNEYGKVGTIVKEYNKRYERIWKTILCVPTGKVASYGQIASLSGLPGRARMVGKCIGEAPSTMPLPWYRILRSNGQLAFKEQSDAASRQRQHLLTEGIVVNNNRVCLNKYQWQPNLDELLIQLGHPPEEGWE